MADEPTWDEIFARKPDDEHRAPRPDERPAIRPDVNVGGISELDALFGNAADGTPEPLPPRTPSAVTRPAEPAGPAMSRRELREREAAAAAAAAAGGADTATADPATADPAAAEPATTALPTAAFAAADTAASASTQAPSARAATRERKPKREKKPKRRGRFIWVFVLLGFLVVGVGAVGAVWLNFEDQVRSVMGWELPNDYTGTGNGEKVSVVIVSGDIGSDIANTLHEAGVTQTYDAFYDLLLEQTEQPNFLPGTYTLQQEMSAQSALDALLEPEARVVSKVTVPEGSTLSQTLSRLSKGTGVPLKEFKAAAKKYTALGVPKAAPSLEGFLFPATYTFDPGLSAKDILQRMVDRMYESLDAEGVKKSNRLEVLTMAALIQKEGGNAKDFYKVSRVFQNRLDDNMLLQSDATVSYGSGGTSISTTDAERADADNPYNTYVHLGLPVGPISAPGDDAIDAALHPKKGAWLYFVLINGDTGETKFSNTLEEHDAAVLVWQAWLRAHPDFDN